MTAALIRPSASATLGLLLLILLLLPPLRHALEVSMSLHMLVQYPALMLAGALLAVALPEGLQRNLRGWNDLGISGLAACALISAVLMIPRVLDLALEDGRFESAKVVALLWAGAWLRQSWRPAGLVVQGFFLGNVLPMMIVVGTLYQDSPLRLCNAYRFDDQQQLGRALVWVAGVGALAWLAHALRRLAALPTERKQGSSLPSSID